MNTPLELFPELSRFLAAREAEFDKISSARRTELKQLGRYVQDRLAAGDAARLTFICTHNSRRSHLSQIWARVAADAVGLSGVQTFSGGTEATAMNPRVVDSLRRSGFRVETDDANSTNPVYQVHYAAGADPLVCFSKVYDEAPNPSSGYCAVMTCSSADDACPIVPGCELRLPIRYKDPKDADDTPEESAVYDRRSRQICREMLFAMQQA
ncbi:low molecular weight phosphatase family protein [Roseimaritima sediminicola]|uniref:protein-tyrosine-phosphatase n=1 Tax=Roseimaritima sediminicola TaxID=2662066 RepID=UPI00129849B7|nr:protein-tyrosine-phosphatase [Roseimaritima sediminicola]